MNKHSKIDAQGVQHSKNLKQGLGYNAAHGMTHNRSVKKL